MNTHNKSRVYVIYLLAFLLLTQVQLPLKTIAATTSKMVRVSVTDTGGEANAGSNVRSGLRAISGDGRYVVFESYASNLITGDTAGAGVFIRDTTTPTTIRVASGNYQSYATIATSGSVVAFGSPTSLVPTDTNGFPDIYIYNIQTGQKTQVSVNSSGGQVYEESLSPALSADGRYVAFMSYANTLVDNDTNNQVDIFVRDTLVTAPKTIRASLTNTGQESNGYSYRPSISADGRYVVFASYATNMTSLTDNNNQPDIFLRDTTTSTTLLVSKGLNNTVANAMSDEAQVSDDGKFVVFSSYASNLVSGDNNNAPDVFLYEIATGTITRISVEPDQTQRSGGSTAPTISGDNRFVAYDYDSDDLATSDRNGKADIYVYDRTNKTTSLVSLSESDDQGNGHSFNPSISSDGRYISFRSDANNLVLAGDNNATTDIFVRDQGDVGIPTYSISGQVVDAINNGIGGVTISVGSAGNAITNATGNYTITGLAAGTYTLTPLKSGYTFLPPSLPVNVSQNMMGQNFTASSIPSTIIDYFALGDSIASGHGLMDDTMFGAPATGCRRALTSQHPAYPLRVVKELEKRYAQVNFIRLPGDPSGQPPIDNFLACSGASVGKPDQSELNKSPYKWLHNQVDAILPRIQQIPSTHPILVSITIGANDFGWGDIDFLSQLLNKSPKDYKLYVNSVKTILRKNIKSEIKRLLAAHPNVKVVVTQYHNPFNPQSIIWIKYPGVLNCFNPKSKLGCYARTEEYGAHAVNDAIKMAISDVKQPTRVAVISDDLHTLFHQHTSPGDPAFPLWACGSAGPNTANTWIQYPSDPYSNSKPDIPDWLLQLAGPWHGDCFHPNDTGAQVYADAVNQAALNLGR
jgi:Tol biopolymer transport system component/lysophospholipase L1-like esterase